MPGGRHLVLCSPYEWRRLLRFPAPQPFNSRVVGNPEVIQLRREYDPRLRSKIEVDFVSTATRYSVPPLSDLSSKAGDARLRASAIRAFFNVIERWQVLDIQTV